MNPQAPDNRCEGTFVLNHIRHRSEAFTWLNGVTIDIDFKPKQILDMVLNVVF